MKAALVLALFLLACASPGVSAAVSAEDESTTPTEAELQAGIVGKGPYVRLELRYPGLYRVTGVELARAGVDLSQLKPESLSLRNEGRLVPIRIVTTREGVFHGEDFLEFVGEAPKGTFSWLKPENLSNVYLLSWSGEPGLRYQETPLSPPVGALKPAVFLAQEHREKDNHFRYSTLPPGTTDNTTWLVFQAGQDSKGMFPLHLDFPGFEPSQGKPVQLTFRFLGFTNVPGLKPGHSFGIRYGDFDLGTFEFDGVGYLRYETSIPASRVKPGQRLTLVTPPGRESVVDQVALDSIEVSYPRKLDAEAGDYFVFNNNLLNRDSASSGVLVQGLKPGSEIFAPEAQVVYRAGDRITSTGLPIADAPTTYVAVSPEGRMQVDAVRFRELGDELVQVPSDLETLVISHPAVAKAADVYTRYRASQGMRIKNVSVPDVFDALNNGFISDRVLKRYIRYVASRSKNLRYVVLIGDSTVDSREATTFDLEDMPRVLIPIHWVYNPSTTYSGGYQDDNWYGSLTDPYRPDLAVGRIPARHDEDAMVYIRKLIEHEQIRNTRDDKALLISSVEKSFQDLVLEVQKKYGDRFTSVSLLFPETTEAPREIERLREAIDSGVQLLYYVGHGGSFVWRVGPSDFQRQKDLFTPAEVRKLKNAGHYPVVACASCYTTSFDQTESLGEVLLLQPDAGAIAVIGSPWKATVHESHAFQSKLIKYYFDGDVKRLGHAALLAHRELTPPGSAFPSFQSFTLLGDPCLEIVKR